MKMDNIHQTSEIQSAKEKKLLHVLNDNNNSDDGEKNQIETLFQSN